MKPLRLTIEGIKSFIEKQSIDFTVLGKSNIFVISGVTGAGKTTVLDCVILALYGKKSELSIDEVVNLRTDKGFTSLDFEAEKNGISHCYRVERTFYRAKNKPSKARLIDLKSGAALAEGGDTVTAAITEMIGLNSKNFTQVVILEQGKYSAFLKAGKSDRTATVGELFGLNRYRDLVTKANSRKKETDVEISALDEYLNSKKDLTASSLAEKKKTLSALKKEETALCENLRKLGSRKDALRAAAEKYAQYESAAKAHETAVAEYEKAETKYREFVGSAQDRQTEDKQIKRLNEELTGQRLKVKAIEECEEKCRTLSAVEKELKNKLAEHKAEHEKYESAVKSLSESKKKSAQASAEIAALAAEINASAMFSVSDAVDAAQAEKHRGKCELLASQSATRAAALAQAESEMKAHGEALAAAEERLKNCESTRAQKQIAYKAARAESERFKSLYEKRLLDDAAESLKRTLHGGDVCPVCGGVVTDLTFEDTAVKEDAKAAAETAEQKAEAARVSLEAAEKEYSLALQSGQTLKEKSAALAEKLSAAKKEYEHAARPVNTTFEKVLELLSSLAKQCAVRESADKDAVKYAAEQNEAQARKTGIESEGKQLRGRQNDLKAAVEAVIGNRVYAVALAEEKAALETLEAQTKAAETARAEREKNLRALEANKANALGNREACFKNAESLKCEKPDERLTEAVNGQIDSAEKRRGELIGEKSALALSIESGEKELAVKREKENRRKTLAAKSDRLKLLAKIFKGEAFMEFIAQEYIEDFCVDASAYLAKMSGGCYTLEYDADAAMFFVKDFRAGNLKRSVRTLSGGETFLASLSLAIAVSKSIAAKNTSGLKFDFLFLDEGFGTLHKDAIGVVENALRSLSRETLVGIVTHRSELSELIPDKLIVDCATESEGSRVRIVS
ncbi:MAG: SMC family ATPase [Clostridia bacterium]|nr:SMC family ATPase [Clostridia bacterium]